MLLTRVDGAAFRMLGKQKGSRENSRGKLKFIELIERAALSHCLIRLKCLWAWLNIGSYKGMRSSLDN